MPNIQVQRVYDAPPLTGHRVLVERLWPRGFRKEALALDAWARDVAPSTDLRRWFAHRPERWEEFRRRYMEELAAHPEAWNPLLQVARAEPLILLYSARDVEHNGALVLKEFLEARS